jgi:hypothetical protein
MNMMPKDAVTTCRRWAATLPAFGLLLLVSPARAAAPVNDCADPYWANTLRCAVFATPHTTLGGPATVAEIKSFTRVFLKDAAVRCADGTIPSLYVDPAVVPSNKWLISMTGGGSCQPVDSDGDGLVDDAQACYDEYTLRGEAREMGTGDDPPMRELFGINSPDPVQNPVFSAYNRVRVEKCSYDRYNGRADWTGLTASATTFDFFQHGSVIMETALATLRPGLTYSTWTNSAGVVTRDPETLPPLEEAEVVLFAGHSGGAHGLLHNIDFLASALDAWAGFDGDVRALIDAHYVTSVENEAAFSSATCPPGAPQGDAYDDIWSGCSLADGAENEYDGQAYYTASGYQVQYDTWQAEHDASCRATHAGVDEWKCRDAMHVLFNHVSTPFLFRQDFSDPNKGHTNPPVGNLLEWGEWDNYAHCALVGTSPCPPRLVAPDEHRPRMEEQALTMWEGHRFRSELALGIDTSGPPPTFYAWMPDCSVHEGAYDNDQFFRTSITYTSPTYTSTYTLRGWLEGFMSQPRTGRQGIRMDGWGLGGATMTSTCP